MHVTMTLYILITEIDQGPTLGIVQISLKTLGNVHGKCPARCRKSSWFMAYVPAYEVGNLHMIIRNNTL